MQIDIFGGGTVVNIKFFRLGRFSVLPKTGIRRNKPEIPEYYVVDLDIDWLCFGLMFTKRTVQQYSYYCTRYCGRSRGYNPLAFFAGYGVLFFRNNSSIRSLYPDLHPSQFPFQHDGQTNIL